MRLKSASIALLLATGFGIVTGRASAQRDEHAAMAVLHQGQLICLGEHGHLRVWGLENESFDGAASAKLQRDGITHLASDGDRLFATDKSTLYAWSPEMASWKKSADVAGGRVRLEALAVVGGSPLLIFPDRVESPTDGRTFRAPKPEGEAPIKYLRVLATHATDFTLWIGTGHGEWGGHLLGLTPRTGEWVQYGDALHYVTGITQASPDELIVSWSMSHFGADTLIRTHKLDATPKVAYPELKSKYYQRVAYSPQDKILYGIENTDIVSITEGRPSKITALDGQLFERERMAIGVSPGVAALLPIARKTLIVVPNHGVPWRLKDGELTRLHGADAPVKR